MGNSNYLGITHEGLVSTMRTFLEKCKTVFALKSEINNPVKYSYDEHVVGTWIDGKPLYERTFERKLSEIQGGWSDRNDGVQMALFILSNPGDTSNIEALADNMDTVIIESGFIYGKKDINIGSMTHYININMPATNISHSPSWNENAHLDMLITRNNITTYADGQIHLTLYTDQNTIDEGYTVVFTLRYTKTTD